MEYAVRVLAVAALGLGCLLARGAADSDRPGDAQEMQPHLNLDLVMSRLQQLEVKMRRQELTNAKKSALHIEQDEKQALLKHSYERLRHANMQLKQSNVKLENSVKKLMESNMKIERKVKLSNNNLKPSIKKLHDSKIKLEKSSDEFRLGIADVRLTVDRCESKMLSFQKSARALQAAGFIHQTFAEGSDPLDKNETGVGNKSEDKAQDLSVYEVVNKQSSKSGTVKPSSSFPFFHQKVFVRSDDASPLEASLAHVTQRVDNMAAKMAAMETSQQTKMAALEASQHASDARQDASIVDAASSAFVRWGKGTCGDHADMVYRGTVGGSWFENTGSAANFLCLPPNPILSSHDIQNAYSYLYGAEFQTGEAATQNKDPVCATCKAHLSTTMMIPATTACPPAWTKHYSGFLMTGAYDHKAASEFICVDSAMAVDVRSEKDENGNLLYYTQTRCGSLPCPPYSNGKVVTCVVCSK